MGVSVSVLSRESLFPPFPLLSFSLLSIPLEFIFILFLSFLLSFLAHTYDVIFIHSFILLWNEDPSYRRALSDRDEKDDQFLT